MIGWGITENAVGDVVDGNVASKVGNVGDNGGMTCGGEVSEGGVEYAGGMKYWMVEWKTLVVWKSQGVVWNTRVAWKSHQWND